MRQTHTFYVRGMHCNSCVVLTENELKNHKLVESAVADLKTCCITVSGDFGDKTTEELSREFSPLLEKHGYSLSPETSSVKSKAREERAGRWADFAIAFPAALGLIAFFVILQQLGILNFISVGEVNYATAFLLGAVASLSTCMIVVGALALSVSANYAKAGDKVRPQILFHISRLLAFFLLGGAIGAIGAAFQIGAFGMFLLTFIVALVMLILGINLLDVFPWAKRLQPTLPKFLSQRLLAVKKINQTITPVLLGAVTFFLPCGFTQAIQLYALTAGSFWTGAVTMFAFALGTLPALAILSFGSLGVSGKFQSSIFFKTAGLVVIFFALLTLLNSFAILGLMPPVFNFIV